MGQGHSGPPPMAVVMGALLQLPPSWRQVLKEALDKVEDIQQSPGEHNPEPAVETPSASSSAAAIVDSRTKRNDMRCGVPCSSCLTGYCNRAKRGHTHHTCIGCERSQGR